MCAGLDNQISLARDEADSTFLAPPLSSQAAITFVGFFFFSKTLLCQTVAICLNVSLHLNCVLSSSPQKKLCTC